MHFTTPLILLSGATAALAGSFAAPASAAHLARRQTNREQILRRQIHSMQKVRRAPSAAPTVCGAPAAFTIQLSQIDSASLSVFNNEFAQISPDGNLTPVEQLADASTFALGTTECNLQSGTGENTLLGNTDGSELSTVYLNTATDVLSFGGVLGSCSVTAGDLSCTYGDADTFNLCTNDQTAMDPTIPITYFLGILSAQQSADGVEGCAPVTLSLNAA